MNTSNITCGILFMVIAIFSSCSSDDENSPQQQEVYPDKYEFNEIIYSPENSERKEILSLSKTKKISNDHPSIGFWYKTAPLIGVTNNSYFESEDRNISTFYLDSIYVKIPTEVSGQNVMLGDSLWRFSYLDFKLASTVSCDSVYIPPKSVVSVDYYLTGYTLSTNFTVKYTNISTKEVFYLKGVWKGKMYDGFRREIDIKPIEDSTP